MIVEKYNYKKQRHSHKSSMLSIDYYAYISKMSKWNPTFKMIFAAILMIISIASNSNIISLIIIFSMAWLTIYVGGINYSNYLKMFALIFSFAFLSSLAIIFNISKLPIGDYSFKFISYYISISKGNIYYGLQIILKALAAISSMYMLVLSTPSYEIIDVLRKIKVPKILIELMNIIYRYIFILMSVQLSMNISAKCRLGNNNFKSCYRSFSGIATNLFLISFKKVSQYYDAMESRCYDGDIKFLIEEKPINMKHVFYSWVYVTLLLIILFITKR